MVSLCLNISCDRQYGRQLFSFSNILRLPIQRNQLIGTDEFLFGKDPTALHPYGTGHGEERSPRGRWALTN